ncbi:hypothetical protein [Allorhizocola rhizosphaerae]|uniref:hypothetical protein n=1 Tax=Allorhizocola rhizosphaerae TaxID=1872709 RepID=UPI0013C339BA|nr:hypothetical protein [Allorhizocola rhizosphaerae]
MRGGTVRVAEGSVGKRCNCTGEDGRRLGMRCSKPRRADGGWSSSHGRWVYQLELPRGRDGKRRLLRRVPAEYPNTRDAAMRERDHAKALVQLAGDDEQRRDDLGALLMRTPSGQGLPSRDTVIRRLMLADPSKSTSPSANS